MESDLISPEELTIILSSLETYEQTGQANSQFFQNRLSLNTPTTGSDSPRAKYLFTIGEWDAIELKNVKAIKMFSSGSRLNKSDLKVLSEPDELSLRYLLLIPSSEELDNMREALRYISAPPYDRAIVLAALLVDDNIYIPLAAEHIGVKPQHSDTVDAMKTVYDAADGLTTDLDRSKLESPPALPRHITDQIKAMKGPEFTGAQKRRFVSDLMSLDEGAWVEAMTRIAPHLYSQKWLGTNPDVVKRTYECMGQNNYTEMDWHNAPHKSGVMAPSPYEPKIRFRYASQSPRDPAIVAEQQLTDERPERRPVP